jgi:hypothetical protein
LRVGIFGKRSPKVVDGSLADGPWLRASEEMFKASIEPYYGSPETMARGGEERYRLFDYASSPAVDLERMRPGRTSFCPVPRRPRLDGAERAACAGRRHLLDLKEE